MNKGIHNCRNDFMMHLQNTQTNDVKKESRTMQQMKHGTQY